MNSTEYENRRDKLATEINEFNSVLAAFDNVFDSGLPTDHTEIDSDPDKKQIYDEFCDWCRENGFLGRTEDLTQKNLSDVRNRIEEHIDFLEEQKNQSEALRQAKATYEAARGDAKTDANEEFKKLQKEQKKNNNKANRDVILKNGIINKLYNAIVVPFKNWRGLGLLGKVGLCVGTAVLVGSVILPSFAIYNPVLISAVHLIGGLVPAGLVTAFHIKKFKDASPVDDRKTTIRLKELRLRSNKKIGKELGKSNRFTNLMSSSVTSGLGATTHSPAPTLGGSTRTSRLFPGGPIPTRIASGTATGNSNPIPSVDTIDGVEQLIQRVQSGQSQFLERELFGDSVTTVLNVIKNNPIGTDENTRATSAYMTLQQIMADDSTFKSDFANNLTNKKNALTVNTIVTFDDYKACVAGANAASTVTASMAFQMIQELESKSKNKAQVFEQMNIWENTNPGHTRDMLSRKILQLYNEALDHIGEMHNQGCTYDELENAIYEFRITYDGVESYVRNIMPEIDSAHATVQRGLIYMLITAKKAQEQQALGSSSRGSRR